MRAGVLLSMRSLPAPIPTLQAVANCPAVVVRFTPHESRTEAWSKKAKTSILVQAYSLTSAPIAKALCEAHTRGVRVEVILDQSNRTDKYSAADFLANQGEPTTIEALHSINHNKVTVIDGDIVTTASFNFTKAAQEKNAKNVLIIRDPALAAQYTQNWQAHARTASRMWAEECARDSGSGGEADATIPMDHRLVPHSAPHRHMRQRRAPVQHGCGGDENPVRQRAKLCGSAHGGPSSHHACGRRRSGLPAPHRRRPGAVGRGRLVTLDEDGCVVPEGNGTHALIPNARVDALVAAE